MNSWFSPPTMTRENMYVLVQLLMNTSSWLFTLSIVLVCFLSIFVQDENAIH